MSTALERESCQDYYLDEYYLWDGQQVLLPDLVDNSDRPHPRASLVIWLYPVLAYQWENQIAGVS
jgi:hypothetical protein